MTSELLETPDNIEALEEALGYKFQDHQLLRQAVTHRSFINESPDETHDNQRFEFLGDSVLGVVIATELFNRFPTYTEGPLSATRASLVNDNTLAEIAETIKLGSYMRLGQGEINSGGRQKTSILADAFEAIIAAIYIDGGFSAAQNVILRLHKGLLAEADPKKVAPKDYKSKLQRQVQHDGIAPPVYEIVSQDGPPHQPTFVATVSVNNQIVAQGKGQSKKAAEQNAAKNALNQLVEEKS